jgi:hypothetical protein
MAKRVNNIAYKGINHSPSLVSDNDGHASECVNLSPDYNDLKPMPMPVKREDYQLEIGYSLLFLHQGIGYENYVEIDETHTRLVFKDAEGNYLYYAYNSPDFPYWSNESEAEILAIEAIGNTVIVSTKAGVEYIIFQPDVPIQGQTGGSYKPIGQRPPMPVIEFRLHEDNDDLTYYEASLIPNHDDGTEDGASISANYDSVTGKFWYASIFSNDIADALKPSISKIQTRTMQDKKFIQPFFVRYAIRLKTGDYIMQSPPILLVPSDGNPFMVANVLVGAISFTIGSFIIATHASALQYKIVNSSDFGDWKEIVDTIDVFISEQINTFDIDNLDGNNRVYDSSIANTLGEKVYLSTENETNIGRRYVDGEIKSDVVPAGNAYYNIKTINPESYGNKVERTVLFHNISSLDINEIRAISNYQDLPIDNLANLATLPTLEDDYYTHNAVSPLLLQVYNSRLNMANISQKVFDGFVNGFQPQSLMQSYLDTTNAYDVRCAYFKVKKNGKTYVVQSDDGTGGEKLDYTTYLYYPDPDCYEMVVQFRISGIGSMSYATMYITIPMIRHGHLNGSYWYDDMKCLGQYISESDSSEWSVTQPYLSENLWYDIPNRFMMSSVGNPWHIPIGNQFDIGRREIRALSLNAENMNAPQYGQNPIYVFSSDGIWTLSINADGTVGKPSYVSGDVVSEMAAIGNAPTAASEQVIFFKTNRGISAIVGSAVKEIDLVMKGRVFNPRTMLLPQGSIVDGVPTIGIGSYWLDLIYNSCDDLPYADFAKESNLLYDYRNNRLLLYHNNVSYMYVYDIRHDFWSKMLPIVVDESETSPAMQEYNTRSNVAICAKFNGTAMAGNNAILTDDNRYMWNVGGQPDENDISGHHFGIYVSRPLRFGTDDMKTLSRIVHDYQLTNDEYLVDDPNPESVRMALYGSRNGKDYYQVKTLRGTAYKLYIVVLYTKMLASSRYAYTAFEWEARMTDKIR